MKRFIVEQSGYVQLEASRLFVVEVPDDMSEEQAEALVDELQDTFPEDEGMAWRDDLGRNWSGYAVEFSETEVYDPDVVVGGPTTKGLTVIRLKGFDTNEQKAVRP